MLVISRKRNQTVRIGDEIVVTVTQIKGTQVRIAIDAPQSVRIRRGELLSNLQKLPADGPPSAETSVA